MPPRTSARSLFPGWMSVFYLRHFAFSSCMNTDRSIDCCVAPIAGTGAVATAFKNNLLMQFPQVGRAGGWGHLFGDAGSAFNIGQRAIQTVLASLEESQGELSSSQPLSPFQAAVLQGLNCDRAHLLSTMSCTNIAKKSSRLLIGSLARLVPGLGLKSTHPDQDALNILHDAAECLERLLKRLIKARASDPSRSILALSGALMKGEPFKDLVLGKLQSQGIVFYATMLVEDPSRYAVDHLARSSYIKGKARDFAAIP